MNKVLLLIALTALLMVCSTHAAVSRGIFKDPAHPGKCAIKKNLILNDGEVVKDPDQRCGRIICFDDGNAQFHTCGTEAIMDGCKFGDYVAPEKNYPDCCARKIIC